MDIDVWHEQWCVSYVHIKICTSTCTQIMYTLYLHMYTHTYVCVYMNIYIYIYICIYISIHIIDMHTSYTFKDTYIHAPSRSDSHQYTHIYVYIQICIYTWYVQWRTNITNSYCTCAISPASSPKNPRGDRRGMRSLNFVLQLCAKRNATGDLAQPGRKMKVASWTRLFMDILWNWAF